MTQGVARARASQSLLPRLLRRVAGARALQPLRALIRPLRPLAAAVRLVDAAPVLDSARLEGWTGYDLGVWYRSPAGSGSLELAQEHARRLLALESVTDAALFIGVGEVLLRWGDTPLAVEAFQRAGRHSPDARYHFGQLLMDHALERTLPLADLLAISALAELPDAMVPDLAKVVLKDLLDHPPAEDDVYRLAAIQHVSAAAERRAVLEIGNTALATGRHGLAMSVYDLAMRRDPHDVLTRLQMGVTEFLAGDYPAAEKQFAIMESTRRAEQDRWGVADLPVTVMHDTWTQAIGHIACLDSYVKSMELGWLPKQRSVLAFDTRNPPIGWPLLKYWGRHIEVLGAPDAPSRTIDQAIWGTKDSLGDAERDRRRAALMSSFWCGRNGDGRVRWYAPLGSDVQHAWHATRRPPLLSVDEDERDRFRTLMEQAFGLPKDAWFVLLHVREPGYKKGWEKTHAYTRNADIETYDAAIQHIVDRGGWVVRGGDPSMRPIAPRPNVIDYATSSLRSPELDILLCAECRFFLGTNSGFSLVPPLFGRRCVLTNWSPMGTPNWYPQDIFIPKLVRRRSTGEFIDFDTMYRNGSAWSQFQRDFEGEFEKLDNTSDDLLSVTGEMLDELEGRFSLSGADQARLSRFAVLTAANGGYPGSRLGAYFAERYERLL